MNTENQLRQVGTDIPVDVAPVTRPAPFIDEAAASMIILALKTLSQKTIVALSSLFTLLTCISAFVLWQDVLPNPTPTQLVGLGLYGVFILLIHLVRRK